MGAESSEKTEQFICGLLTEVWRMQKSYESVLEKTEEKVRKRYENQSRFFVKRIMTLCQENGFKLVNYEGSAYDPGFPIDVVNMSEFSDTEKIMVAQMLEPVIMKDNRVLKSGLAIVRGEEV